MKRDYLGLLLSMMPPGPAWSREVVRDQNGRVIGGAFALVLDAIAEEFQALDDHMETIIREANPLTASALLPAHYDDARLPLPCLPRAETPEQMRSEILYSWAARGGASVGYIVKVLAKFNTPSIVREFRPFRIGVDAVGSTPLYGDSWMSCFQVSAVDVKYRHFSAGESSAGNPLQEWSKQSIACLVNSIKPAHMRALFRFVKSPDDLEWSGDDFGIEAILYDDDGTTALTDEEGNYLVAYI